MQQDDKRRDYTPGQGGQHDQDVEHQGGRTGGDERKDQSSQGGRSGQQQQGGRKGNQGDRKVE